MITSVKSINKRVLARIIARAQEILKPSSQWHKDGMAGRRNSYGGYQHTAFNDPGAVCWCASGAIAKAVSEMTPTDKGPLNDVVSEMRRKATILLNESLPKTFTGCTIVQFNDSIDTTHKQLVSVFSRALAKLSQK